MRHERSIGKSQVHLTPRWILDRLGPFELDPCAAEGRPWDCATINITEAEDGLSKDWEGRVWLNPPFDRRTIGAWIERMAAHGCGTALVHARTDTAWFQTIWKRSDAMLFVSGRIKFCSITGVEQEDNSGAPVMLAAFGLEDAVRLRRSAISGQFLSKMNRLAAIKARLGAA